MSPLKYQRAARLLEAVREVPAGKIDAIALEVGYKSKKGFYKAFEELTGVTPSTFRSLSVERAAVVVESIRLRQHRLSDLSSRTSLGRRADES
jgi:AraC-like DNA-binding protein